MKKDAQDGFKDFIEPLQEMVDANEVKKNIKIPADGNWFTLDFKAVQVKENRLVITAKRSHDGWKESGFDPSIKKYIVEFSGTRAAYLYGSYELKHIKYGWPYIHWDIRSYANHPNNSDMRVYVNGFRAPNELKKLIRAMEDMYGTSNIFNTYINDNLFRFQSGIKLKKTPQQIEKEWSQGLMESLGYQNVEAFDCGRPENCWNDVKVHWCKKKQDLRG